MKWKRTMMIEDEVEKIKEWNNLTGLSARNNAIISTRWSAKDLKRESEENKVDNQDVKPILELKSVMDAVSLEELKDMLGGTGRDLIVANDLMRLSRLDGENQQLRIAVNKLEDEISRIRKGNHLVARLNFSALVSRLTSLSSMLVDIYTGDEKKKKMKKRMEHLNSAIRLLVNDIQFPLKDKDIFMEQADKYFAETEPSTVDFDFPDHNDYNDEEY